MEDMNASMPSPAASPAPASPQKEGELWAALSYLPLVFVLTTMKKGNDPFYLWHAKNAAALFVIELIFFLLTGYLIPVSFVWFSSILNLVLLVVAVFSMYKAWNHQKWVLPIVSDVAQSIPLEKWFKPQGATVAAPVEEVIVPESAPAPVEAAPACPAPSAAEAEMPACPVTPEVEAPQAQAAAEVPPVAEPAPVVEEAAVAEPVMEEAPAMPAPAPAAPAAPEISIEPVVESAPAPEVPAAPAPETPVADVSTPDVGAADAEL